MCTVFSFQKSLSFYNEFLFYKYRKKGCSSITNNICRNLLTPLPSSKTPKRESLTFLFELQDIGLTDPPTLKASENNEENLKNVWKNQFSSILFLKQKICSLQKNRLDSLTYTLIRPYKIISDVLPSPPSSTYIILEQSQTKDLSLRSTFIQTNYFFLY